MNPKDFGRIGVLAGGPSNEREISLESGRAVFDALKETGAEAIFLDVKKELTKNEIKRFDIDVAFIALHGRFGEDGTIQKMLEEADIPYTGSGPTPSRLALDKITSREIFCKNGIDVPRYKVLNKTQTSLRGAPPLAGRRSNPLTGRLRTPKKKEIASVLTQKCQHLAMTEDDFDFPLVVKPQFEGSSIGVSIVNGWNELTEASNIAFDYGDKILIEEYIRGRELTVGILENEPLPVIEIVAKEQFYNFRAKYKRTDTEYIVPAQIDEGIYKRAQAAARSAHLALGCESFSRVDMMLDEKQDRLFMLEVNSIPGLTSHSLLPKAAEAAGISFDELCLRIIKSAIKKRPKCHCEPLTRSVKGEAI